MKFNYCENKSVKVKRSKKNSVEVISQFSAKLEVSIEESLYNDIYRLIFFIFIKAIIVRVELIQCFFEYVIIINHQSIGNNYTFSMLLHIVNIVCKILMQ